MEVKKEKAVCPWCIHADVLEDICGVYCRVGQKNPDGKCRFFIDYLDDFLEMKEGVMCECQSNATSSR